MFQDFSNVLSTGYTTSTYCLIEEEKEPLVDKVLETSIHPAIGEAVSAHIENKTSNNIILQASTSEQIESSKDLTTLATNKPTQTSHINIEQSSTPCYKAPDIFKEVIKKGNTDNKDEKAILDRIINLPDVVNDILSDWTLIITSENIAKTYWDVNSTQKYSGLTLPNIKTIIISNLYNECTLHEIGHIIDVENEWAINTNVFTNIYEKEKYGIGIIKDNTYYISNNHEYFAESFKMYVENAENLKMTANETYLYINNLLHKDENS